MLGRIRNGLAALLAAGLLFGCGDGKSRNPRGQGDRAEERIKAAEKSAVASCVQRHCDILLRDLGVKLNALREPVDELERQVLQLEGEKEDIGGGETGASSNPRRMAELTKELAVAKRKLNKLKGDLREQLMPLNDKMGMLRGLRKSLSGTTRTKSKICDVVSHEVDEFNDKAPGQRTSTLTIKPAAYFNVLGRDEMKFKLTWRRVARKIAYSKKVRVSFELSQAVPVGAKKPKKNTDSSSDSDTEE